MRHVRSEVRPTSTRVKELAHNAGFPLVGITPAVPLERAGEYRRWLDHGYHASMEWMARNQELREDPARLVPGAQSVLCLATPYKTHDPPPPESGSTRGIISNYAWGDDYHVVIRLRLDRLWQALTLEFPGISGRSFVDTGPILERDLAARAGLGWIGKHSLLINKALGSYVFLAEIISTLELEPDLPAAEHCGTCTRCLEVCPTNAFPEPYVLDSAKCISYQTIEHRGELNPAVASAMGNLIYGCDLCQAVCPWNRKAPSTLDPAFQPRAGELTIDLLALAEDQEGELYRTRTRGSAMKRSKQAGLQRNAQAALANANRDV